MKLFYKTADVLYKLGKLKIANITELAKEVNITYAQLHKYIKQFRDMGFVEEVKTFNRKERVYKLTNKGQIIANSISTIKEQL